MEAKYIQDGHKFEYDMSNSIYIDQEYVLQVCEFAPNKLLLQLWKSEDLLIVHDWETVVRVKVPGGCTLDPSLLLPGFHSQSFPFLLDYGTISDSFAKLYRKQSDSFDLVNL